MIDYIYEVRFPQNPVPTFAQKFSSKNDALNFSDQYPGSEVYMLELDYDDYMGTRGIGNLVSEVQIRGAEAEANVKAGMESGMDTCACDNDDNYINGKFRAPKLDDDLDDAETATADEDDMTDDELGEALFSAIQEKVCKVNPVITHTPDDEAILKEDSAGMVDDSDLDEDEANCTWCGEKFPISSLKLEKDLGYICPQCLVAIHAHEGDDSIDIEDDKE